VFWTIILVAMGWAIEVLDPGPELRGRGLHELNKKVYKALNREGIQIPFPQRDLHVKEMPGRNSEVES
jgi:small-conductance mechanosensitive channel